MARMAIWPGRQLKFWAPIVALMVLGGAVVCGTMTQAGAIGSLLVVWLRGAVSDDTNHQGKTANQHEAHNNNQIFQHTRLTLVKNGAGNGRVIVDLVLNRVIYGVHMSSSSSQKYVLTAEVEDDNMRLDQFLAAGIKGLSRSRLKVLIKDGQVYALKALR